MHLGGHGYSGVAPSLTQMLPDPTMGPEKNQHHDGGSLASTVAVFAANTSQPVEQYSTGVQVTSQTDGRETPPMSKNLTDHGCQFRSPVSPVKKKVPASPPSSHRSQPTKSRPKQQQQQQQHRVGKRPRRRIYNSSITVAAQPAIKTKAVAITPNSSPSSSSSFSPLSSPSSKSKAPRIFVCSFAHYGCDKVFPFKNEWKRHIATKHLQLGFYRCDVEGCNIDEQLQQAKKNNKKKKSPVHTRSTSSSSSSSSSSSISEKKPALRYNDFNRKDLFTQHQRRMHSPWAGRADRASPSQEEQKTFDQGLDVVHHRCWRERRQPPTRSRCGFCGEEFEGPMSWDKRMEHVGKHYERGDYDREKVEMEDEFLRDWGVDTGVIQVVQPGREWRLTSLIEKERG
ncbi:hypothetical protein ASPZODRAFT_133250 [Penicilliopsis zonata CBS 506.65]|uniref:C2H2-type domain-containing protein n=1 Tax=Penicilliopsis zonata CBS 506.65 TaxID=1073090 RepID=A0A1L9SG37_9EURO|nr:hypothetical protein ASPZODRAFT_133250 [Penicilliopsis zonata CBS 506.65]OJJ46235.1 hypothetical protein ASPZODRAFT_133250 [Penicilliopsis zonata CBS 506.65]